MKHQNFLIKGLLSFILLLMAGAMKAQTQDVRIGYCGTRTGASLRFLQGEVKESNQLGAAVYLPAELLKKYVGDTIYKISFANETKVGAMATVFVTTDLWGTALSSKNTRDFAAGWNTVTLTNPVVINGLEGLYIGYMVYPSADEIGLDYLTCEFEKSGTRGVNFYFDNSSWVALDPAVDFDFCVRALAKGKNKPAVDLGLQRIDNYSIVRQNKASNVTLFLSNYGLEEVTNFNIEASAGGKVFATMEVDNVSLAHNETSKIDINDVIFPFEGNNNFTVKVTNINKKVDSDPSDNEKGSYVYAVPENAKARSKTVLLEEFTTESTKNNIPADSLYAYYVNDRTDVIWMKYHILDDYKLDKTQEFKYFFKNNKIGSPMIMVDRNQFENINDEDRGPAYFVPFGATIERMLETASRYPTFIDMDLTATWDEATRKVKVAANVESEVREMPEETSLRLTVCVVEDGIVSTKQKGIDSYVHNNIVRAFVTESAWGDVIDIKDYAELKEYEFTLPDHCNPANTRIVAFINNYDDKNYANNMVYNSAQTPLIANSIGSVNIENGTQLRSANGQIFAGGDAQIVGIYDLTGRKYDNNSLANGLYIVEVVKNGKKLKMKYLVK